MLEGRRLKVWIGVHRWTSLISTAFLLLLCVTGLPLIFGDEIQTFLDRHYSIGTASGEDASLDRVTEAALEKYPGQFIQSFYWDERIPKLIRLSLGPKPNTPFEDVQWITVDAESAQVLDDAPVAAPFLTVLLDLHRELLAGVPGALFLGAVGMVFLASLVSGIVVYAPFARKLPFGAVRRERSRRTAWLDLHNFLGIVTAAWVIVVGATGVMNTLATTLFDYWQADTVPRLLEPYRGRPLPAEFIPVQAAADAARAAVPGSQLFSFVYPSTDGGSPRHYVVWTHGDTPLTAELFTPVLIDAETGAVTEAQPLPWYLRALEISRPLHFGDYGGLALKVLWGVLDGIAIFVLVSGLYLWRGTTGKGDRLADVPVTPTLGAPRVPSRRPRTSPFTKSFTAPILLWGLTALGLLSAFFGQGAWRWLSCLMLAAVPATSAWIALFGRTEGDR